MQWKLLAINALSISFEIRYINNVFQALILYEGLANSKQWVT